MPKDIEPKLKLIGDYLKIGTGELFVIPEYQRKYSWTVQECDKLWQDVETFMDSGEVNESGKKEPYFFGTVIADCSEPNTISLIDGQQRTTTFILLLRALLLRIQEILKTIAHDEDTETLEDGLKDKRGKIVDILCQTDADHRREFLKDWGKATGKTLIESKSINELDEYKRELQLIVEAKSFQEAEMRCHKIPRKQKDNKYTNFFRNFKFFCSRLSDCSESRVNAFAKCFLEECQIIEIRSWNTEQAITMFNSLNSTGMPLADADIISAQLYSNAGSNKAEFTGIWESLTKKAEVLGAGKIASMDSLLQQYMYISRAEGKVYIREGNRPDVTTPGVRKYYTIDCKNLLQNPIELCGKLHRIADIWEHVKDYPVVKLLLKFNENAKLFLISYLNRYEAEELTENKVIDVAECLLRLFSVLELVDAGYSSAKFKTFLFGENIKLVDKNVPVDVITKEFSSHISKTWDKGGIEGSLLEYDKNILVFLNEYLYAKAHGVAFDFADSVNIEHIMPASGHNIEAIRLDAEIETREEFVSFANKLGNKILLEEDINKSIGNDWFRTKKQKSIIDKAGYKDSRYHIARALTAYGKDKWTKDDIDTATLKVAERISRFIFAE
jgi:uncharacterized protein with ParB-like and HNH nuclease domain